MSTETLSESDQSIIDDLRETFIIAYGSDLSLNAEGNDIEIVGGDINTTGTFPGNTLIDVKKLITDRIKTRIATNRDESIILGSDYGSSIGVLVGLSKSTPNNVIDKLTQTLVHTALLSEPLIESDSVEVEVIIEDEALHLIIKAVSGIISVEVSEIVARGD